MLMIILGILKVIGILFLVLLSIILLFILLALFCPVRYQGAAERREGQPLKASGDVTWLLHFLYFRVTVEGTQPAVSVRILGISPEGFGRFVSAFHKKAKQSATVDTTPIEKSTEEGINAGKSQNTDESAKKDFSENTIKNRDTTTENSNTLNAQKSFWGKVSSGVKKTIKQITSSVRKILDILKKIFHLPERVAKGINQGITQGKAAVKKVSAMKAFISTREFKEALTFGLGRVARLLHHLRPQKLTGNIEFGFSDPADTGMALAVLAPFFPYYAEHLQMVPDFQKKRLSFSLKFKGRIFGCMLLYIALQTLMDRNIRIVIGKIRKRRSE